MSWVTITDNNTNEILSCFWIKKTKQSEMVRPGQTLHENKYPIDEFVFDGTSFTRVQEPAKDLTEKEIIVMLVRELEAQGINLTAFRKKLNH